MDYTRQLSQILAEVLIILGLLGYFAKHYKVPRPIIIVTPLLSSVYIWVVLFRITHITTGRTIFSMLGWFGGWVTIIFASFGAVIIGRLLVEIFKRKPIDYIWAGVAAFFSIASRLLLERDLPMPQNVYIGLAITGQAVALMLAIAVSLLLPIFLDIKKRSENDNRDD